MMTDHQPHRVGTTSAEPLGSETFYDSSALVPETADAPWESAANTPETTPAEQIEATPVAAASFPATLPPLEIDERGGETIEPAEISWKRVSPRYVKVRLLGRALWSVIMVAIFALPLIFTEVLNWWNWPLWVTVGLVAIMLVWQIWLTLLVSRQVKAIGYSERQDHILRTSGIMFKSMRAIPYGRIQYVDVKSGPIEGKLKLASVTITTASGTISIPGVERPEAERLREILTDLSDAKMVGL
ncbi:PH domain-containing protein [Rothia sp. ZJ932]|uniref:PH domain-containing protein n=1 Tax=Rothia sp. ZJ932 TaxID=2810516 RepID=UPI0019677C6F|nr:PH domain-containing protein [Rothia sp. ZJ932]QRZ61755.1 PH domain-containing protein [Rothia sp. ZJ932]